MDKKELNDFIQKTKAWYFRINSISCPAFNDELVYFNKPGWNHLLRKGKKLRSLEERLQRVNLLKYAPYIIARSKQIDGQRRNTVDGYSAHFWIFCRFVENMSIRVVIRQLNDGRKHFFSIMQEKTSR